MMKKQLNNNISKSPTCGNCMHSCNGYRCSIFTKWQILPNDSGEHCDFHFYRVPKKYMKYYKHRPVMTKGWPDSDIEKYWEYIKDLRRGIVSDNNGGYFMRYPFGEKIICST